MPPLNAAAVTAAAAAAAANHAIRAMGVLVQVEPQAFQALVDREENLLVVQSTSGILTTSYHYLTSYKGLAFYTVSSYPLVLPKSVEVITAKKVWMPR
jgi:hypothetical protein